MFCVTYEEGPLIETAVLTTIVFTGVMTRIDDTGLVHRVAYFRQPVANDAGFAFERIAVARSVTTIDALLKMNREDAAFLARELAGRNMHALNS